MSRVVIECGARNPWTCRVHGPELAPFRPKAFALPPVDAEAHAAREDEREAFYMADDEAAWEATAAAYLAEEERIAHEYTMAEMAAWSKR